SAPSSALISFPARRSSDLDAWNARNASRMRLFAGVEADILADGSLDYADEPGVLESLDFVIGSVHSNFRMGSADMTRRMLRALRSEEHTSELQSRENLVCR